MLSDHNLHLVRYGIHNDAKYLQNEFLETYDVVVINGNMAAHSATAMAKFISTKAQNKAYLIDPQTHALQHDLKHLVSNKTGELKESIQKLLQFFGEPVYSRIKEEKRPISFKDFSDRGKKKEFVQNVLQFQKEVLSKQAADDLKYYQYAGIENPVQPMVLVAPYFYMEETTLDCWLPLNLEFVETAKQLTPNQNIFMQVVISKDILVDMNLLRQLSEKIRESAADGIFLWIDDFDEKEAGLTLLSNYVDLLSNIGKCKQIINLYGSYFSIALMKTMPGLNLVGVCHGLEYGESRPVIPVGGGLPVSKFYYPALHSRVRYEDAVRLARPYLKSKELYFQHVCKCPKCRELMNMDTLEEAFAAFGEGKPITFKRSNQIVTLNYPTEQAHDNCVKHYLWNKHREFRENIKEAGEIANQLAESAREFEDILGTTGINYLLKWAKVLRKGVG
ncbi:MAG: hypothetical protein AB1556_16185 [Bacillota bacterium]